MSGWMAEHGIELAGFAFTLLVTIIGWVAEHRSAKDNDSKRREDIERVNKQVAALEKQADEASERNRVARAALDVSRQQLDIMRSRLEIERETASRQPVEPPYVPPWRLSWVRGSMYAITNGGSDVEHDVRIELPDGVIGASDLDFDKIGPMSSETFMAALTWSSSGRQLTVTWRHGSESERRSWSSPLPARV